jgi:hypothetical protein
MAIKLPLLLCNGDQHCILMIKMHRISIPQPCHENWNNMVPNEKGAFCNACAKTVVDFTGMSDEEVSQYFLQHAGQKTCGRFLNTQLNSSETATSKIDLRQVLSSAVPYWKKFLAIVLIAFGTLLTGCSDHTTGTPVHILGDTVAPGMLQRPIDTTIMEQPPAPVDSVKAHPTHAKSKRKKCTVMMTTTGLVAPPRKDS